jgi:hypothetical protein
MNSIAVGKIFNNFENISMTDVRISNLSEELAMD